MNLWMMHGFKNAEGDGFELVVYIQKANINEKYIIERMDLWRISIFYEMERI